MMASDATITTIVDGILGWCGVSDPTFSQLVAAEWAAQSAVDTIQHYRGLGEDDELEAGYLSLAVEMGVYAFEKRGVDGTTQFSEAGGQRIYEVGSFPPSMLSRITPPARTG
jgi:hypothetical protein